MKKLLLNEKNLLLGLYFILFCLISGLLLFALRKQTQSFYFMDETDHVAMGWMMNVFDKTLYTDLSTNHQPLPVLVGALFAKFISYSTLFELVERLRLAMFIYASIWAFFIGIRFKLKGLFSYALTYSVGYYFLSWHVLAESIAAPAVIFLFLLLIEKIFYEKKLQFPFPSIDAVAAGICLTVLVSSLLPLWPFSLFIFIILFFLFTKKERYVLLSSLFVSGTLFLFFITPAVWWQETILNNLRYFIPYQPKLGADEYLRIFFFPFLSFLKPADGLSLKFLPILVLTIFLVAFSIYKKVHIKARVFFFSCLLYFLLISLNNRVFIFPIAFYEGFHLFPFIAGLMTLLTSFVLEISYNFFSKRYFTVIVFIVSLIFFYNLSWGFKVTDKLNEYYVQYGTDDSLARLIDVFKSDGDTFFSGPDGRGYINMITGLPIAGRQLFHLQWAYLSPQLREEFHSLFEKNPPAFVLYYDDGGAYGKDLHDLYLSKYTQVLHDSKSTSLYFRDDKVSTITPQQKKYMQEKDFSFSLE